MSLFFAPCDLWRKCAAYAIYGDTEHQRATTETGLSRNHEPAADRPINSRPTAGETQNAKRAAASNWSAKDNQNLR